jgi:hypothetical protein
VSGFRWPSAEEPGGGNWNPTWACRVQYCLVPTLGANPDGARAYCRDLYPRHVAGDLLHSWKRIPYKSDKECAG